MNSFWQAFLEQQGAAWNHDGFQTNFATPPADRPWLMDLSYQGILGCDGEAAEKFLQGQLTCNVAALNASTSGLGGLCNPKGSLLSLFRLLKSDSGYLFGMRRELVEPTKAVLSKYIVFFKAQLQDRSDEVIRLGLAGKGADNILYALFDAAPEHVDDVLTIDGGWIIRVAGEQPRFELWLQPDVAKKLWVPLTEHANLASSEHWEALEIAAALPDLTLATREQHIPQMMNLQAIGGVSFKKGCYTGQEIVARMQYLGKLKRHLFRAEVSTSSRPSAGQTIHCQSKEDLGQVVRAAQLSDGRYALLAVLYKQEAESEPCWLAGDESAVLDIQPLPYTIDPEVFERNRPKL